MPLAEAVDALVPAELAAYKAAVDQRDATPGFLGSHWLEGGRLGDRRPNPARAAAETAVGEARRAMMAAFARALENRGLQAVGRNGTPNGPEEPIRPLVWRFFTDVDLAHSRAFGHDGTAFVHIEVRARADSPAAAAMPAGAPARPRGRPSEYPWEQLLAEFAVWVSVNPMPRKQAEFVRIVQELLGKLEPGRLIPPGTVTDKLQAEWALTLPPLCPRS